MALPSRTRTLLIGALFVTLYFAVEHAAMWFEITPGVSLWYPPPGLLLTLLLVLGLRWLPLALLTSGSSAFLLYPMPHVWATVTMVLNSVLGYAAVAALLRAMLGRPPRLEQMSHALVFALVLLVAALPMAMIGSTVLIKVGLAAPGDFGQSVFRWWLGDTAGILSVLPLLLINVAPRLTGSAARRPTARTAREWLEIGGQAVALLGSLVLVYAWAPLRDHHVPYISFVPLTWIVLRHGLAGAGWAIFGVNVGSMFVLKVSQAPEHALTSFLLFQFAATAMGLALGAMVTRRERVEVERNRLLQILEETPDFIGTATPDGRVIYLNNALRGLQRGPAEPQHLRDFHPPWAAEKILREGIPAALAQGRWSGETALLGADGREIPVSQLIMPHPETPGSPATLFTVARDISEQRRAEELRLSTERKMLDAQKLESLGVLAGGIAHDFNNLLTTMLGNANLARLDLALDAAAHRNLEQIEHAAMRAAELCQQMLAYSGKGQREVAIVDLSALVSDTAHLMQVSVPKKSTLSFELGPNLPGVKADATQLRQVVMNLVLNAAEAVGDGAGHIKVSTGAMRADAAWLAASFITPPPPPGDYVYLEVVDDGRGMSPETKARIFEPFFTTKFTGHGLGLSAVLGIVRGHGGTLQVHSAIDQGTRFRVALPAAGEVPHSPTVRTDAFSWSGTGRILVVDDEETVRVVTARILESCGFTVELAANGAEAVEWITQSPDGFRAVIMDVLMPVLDGIQALEEIRRLRPRLPVLLVSGYSGPGVAMPRSDPATLALTKPFPRDVLLRTLHKAIEPKPPG